MDHPFGDRFEVIRRLGEGGMGVVYEALDRERRERVALKTMRLVDAATLYRFKNEFRALAEVAHPNLVSLYELVTHAHATFFTMELVDGVDLIQHVRFGAESAFAETLAQPSSAGGPAAEGAAPQPARATFDATRLRASFVQLCRGVQALHEAGKLHRDIKPSNVIVRGDGRVMLLDFGLVASLDEDDGMSQEILVGTPEYMSPEQASSGELGPASDWYSVGVVLYEALTGQLPFGGPRLRAMIDKQGHDAPAARDITPDLPSDLDELCTRLLARSPGERPTGAQILASLGDAAALPQKPTSFTHSTLRSLFLGREDALAELDAAFGETRAGRAAAVFVHGASGMGKSALLRRFVEAVRARGNALILSGRCYDNESVPYKAFDGLIDSLSRHLRGLTREEAEGVLPIGIAALARVFPVLTRVDAVGGLLRQRAATMDPQELRRRAIAAFRELLERIAVRRPLVLWIDDAQWGDVDSLAILSELLRPPDVPPYLLIVSYRTEDEGRSPFLRALLDPEARRRDEASRRTVALAPLSRDDSARLALSLLGGDDEEARTQAGKIAVEARGIPLFVDELVRKFQSGARTHDDGGALRLDDALRARIETFSADARALLAIIAVAGQPLARELVVRAAGIERSADAVAALRAGRLARTLREGEQQLLETYHDRIREAVLDSLSREERATMHRRLVEAFLDRGNPDPEVLLPHLLGAGDAIAAHKEAIRAGDRAIEALAFVRAAGFYEIALRLGEDPDDAARRALRRKLGDALASAGRGGDAARAYLGAAEGATTAESLDLRRRAAEQFMASGHFEEGLVVVRDVLKAVGLRYPATPLHAVLSIVWSTFVVWMIGLRVKARDMNRITQQELIRIDVCWSIGTCFLLADPIRALAFQKQFVRRALRAAEETRLSRAIASESAFTAGFGGARGRRKAVLAEHVAEELARRTGRKEDLAFARFARGAARYMECEFLPARDELSAALRMFRDDCSGVGWPLSTVQTFLVWSLWQLGDTRELARFASEARNDAQERGDLALAVNMRKGLANVTWLVADDVDRALTELDAAARSLGGRMVPLQQYYEVLARAHVALYAGEGARAWAMVAPRMSEFRRAMVFEVRRIDLEACALHGRSAVAAAVAADAAARPALLGCARLAARKLLRVSERFNVGEGRLLQAAIAKLQGRRDDSVDELRRAIDIFRSTGTVIYDAVARGALGVELGAEVGAADRCAFEAVMRAQGVRRPTALSRMIAPGLEVPVVSIDDERPRAPIELRG